MLNTTHLLAATNCSDPNSGHVCNPILGPALQQIQQNSFTATGSPTDFFATIIPNLITMSFILGVLISFFWLLWGGIRWITAGGDKTQYDAAQKHVTQAVVGLALLFAMIAFFKLLENFLDIQILKLDLTNLYIK